MLGIEYKVEFARELLLGRWGRLEKDWDECVRTNSGQSAAAVETCPALWILPELLELMDEDPQLQPQDLKPQICRMLLEQDFVDENGDTVIAEGHCSFIDRQADLIIEVLHEMRQNARARGEWRGTPAAPQMFG